MLQRILILFDKEVYKEPSLEAVAQRSSVKKMFLETSQNSQQNICARVFFAGRPVTLLKKETLTQVISYEF